MSPKTPKQDDRKAKALQSAVEKMQAKGVDTTKTAGGAAYQGRISNA